jgi:hypothetical protein
MARPRIKQWLRRERHWGHDLRGAGFALVAVWPVALIFGWFVAVLVAGAIFLAARSPRIADLAEDEPTPSPLATPSNQEL